MCARVSLCYSSSPILLCVLLNRKVWTQHNWRQCMIFSRNNSSLAERITLIKMMHITIRYAPTLWRCFSTAIKLWVCSLSVARGCMIFIATHGQPDNSVATHKSATFCKLNTNLHCSTDVAQIRRWFSDCNVVFEEMVPNFACHSVGEKRIGTDSHCYPCH